MLRTATLQLSITVTTAVAAGMGVVALATHQVINSLWSFLAFAFDALAIAPQAIVGRYLGAGNVIMVRRLTVRMIGWGVVSGVGFGVIVAPAGRCTTSCSPRPRVQTLLFRVLLVVARCTPIAGVVFVLDRVLIGARDGRYLALAGLIAMIAYLPLAISVHRTVAGLLILWVAYALFMVARMITLVLRAHGTRWMRIGS